MDLAKFFEEVGKMASVAAALVGAWWAFEKWRKRDEHFPRIGFEVTANFLGIQDGQIVTEVVAVVENKGVVPLKIKAFSFVLRGIGKGDSLSKGTEAIRGQLLFGHELAKGPLIPEKWEYSFVYPLVKTEYNFVTAIPQNISFVRVQADFLYLVKGESHHAAKILKIPEFSTK